MNYWHMLHEEPSKLYAQWSSCCGAAETNPISIHEDAGSIPGLAQRVKDSSSIAVAQIWSLAWEVPYAAGTALKCKIIKRKRKLSQKSLCASSVCQGREWEWWLIGPSYFKIPSYSPAWRGKEDLGRIPAEGLRLWKLFLFMAINQGEACSNMGWEVISEPLSLHQAPTSISPFLVLNKQVGTRTGTSLALSTLCGRVWKACCSLQAQEIRGQALAAECLQPKGHSNKWARWDKY